jgi:hypothetical protein
LNRKPLRLTIISAVSVASLVAGMAGVAHAAGAARTTARPATAERAADGDSPQGKKWQAEAAPSAVPDECLIFQQLNPDEQKYRNTNNAPFTYDVSKYGDAWFDVACGRLTFTVPRGQQALVDLTAVAELDCQSDKPSNAWCGGRFLVNGVPTEPDNTDRADSYAWDSANGGAYDWQANTLAQEYVANCPQDGATNGPCVYKVQLQSRLENGATSVWIDDLTVRVDVSEGPVRIGHESTTP